MKQWLQKKYQKIHDSFTYQFYEYVHYCILYDKACRPHIYDEIVSAPDDKLPEIRKRIMKENIVAPYYTTLELMRMDNIELTIYKSLHFLEIITLASMAVYFLFRKEIKKSAILHFNTLGNASLMLLADIIIRFTRVKQAQNKFQAEHSLEFKKYKLFKKII